MKELMEMLKGKSDQPEMSEMEKQAKMEVLKELIEMAMSQSGKSVSDGMQELSIMAPDKEGLMEGMDTAQDMMEEMPEDMPEMMSEEMPEMDEDEDEDEDY